jgi:hypothetical protein
MNGPTEFHYRLPGRASGSRPGSHPGTSLGVGQEFAMHARLVDYPDPRRLDLRASVQSVRGEWLVRLSLQRVAVPVHAVVDVSSSMRFGARRTKLDVVADFVEALGFSGFRSGDRVGMSAFDANERDDLFVPPRHGRGAGELMAGMLRAARTGRDGDGASGLARALMPLAGRPGLVFIASDFHWPLESLPAVLDTLSHASVVPIIVWDTAELEPPDDGRLLAIHDVESGARRTVWLSQRARGAWRQAVARRRAELDALFAKRSIRPFYVVGAFDADALSRYFMEQSV